MKLVLAVAGDRYYSDYSFFSKVVRDELQRYPATEIVTGDCTGVDTMAYDFAVASGIPYTIFCASRINFERLVADGACAMLISDWRTHGKVAGPYRNEALSQVGNRLLLFDGGGPGSRSVKKCFTSKHKEVEIWNIQHHYGVEQALVSVVQGGTY